MLNRAKRTITDQLATLASSLPGSPAFGFSSSIERDNEAEMAFVGHAYRSVSSSGITAPTTSTHNGPSSRTSPWDTYGGGGGSTSSNKARLIRLWLLISPITTIVLMLFAYREYRANPHPEPVRIPGTLRDKLNPYACAPKTSLTSLTEYCRSGQNQDQHFREQVKGYEVRQDRHFTQDQCDAIFPKLYYEIDRAIDYWKERGGVAMKDLDEAEPQAQARVLIIKNRMYIKSYGDNQPGTRTKALLGSIRDALISSLEPLPDVEFVLMSGDAGIPVGAAWSLSRLEKQPQLTLVPDFGFFSWPEPGVGGMVEVADKCQLFEQGTTWKDKIPRLFWRGAFMVDIRKEFWEIARKYKWGEVSDLEWGDKDRVLKEVLSPEQHCGYKYLGHAEGYTYSGRGKNLLHCRSVVVAHKMQFIQHFHHLFNSDRNSPDQNIVISPGRNFDELPETMQWLIDNDKRAEQIADNSYNHFRHYLSPASVGCYWRRLIHRWAEVQNYTPELPRDVASYESFILIGRTHWVPY